MLKAGVKPDDVTFNTLISKSASAEQAGRWYEEMLKAEVGPDEITRAVLVKWGIDI
jgi:hypothetical protein